VTRDCTVNQIQEHANGRKQPVFRVFLMKIVFHFTASTQSAQLLNVSQLKMRSNFHIFFILILFSVSASCSGMKKEPSANRMQTENNAVENIDETQEKETVAGKITVRDIYSGETYPLEKISMHYPVFIEISASWCPACKEMEKTTEKLYEYFKGKVFFIRLFMAGDGSFDENSVIPSMEIASSPEEMKIEYSEALPRVLILSRNGKETVADLTGTYPLLYYYGILSEL